MAASPARRFAWLMLLVAALFARGLAPEGWMPTAGAATGIRWMPCDGMGGARMPATAADGKTGHHKSDHGGHGDHPCAFAGVAVVDTATPPLALAPPVRIASPLPPPAAFDRFPGRGLAAPPPPATGPPARA